MRRVGYLIATLRMGVFAAALLLTGCTAPTPEDSSQPEVRSQFAPNRPMATAETEKAQAVLARHLVAYSEGNLEAVLETVPLNQGDVYRSNTEQMARHKGFRVRSITARPSMDQRVGMLWSDYVNPRMGYTAVIVFRVQREYPNSTPDDVLLEDFDAIMARTPGGRWLYVDSMAN